MTHEENINRIKFEALNKIRRIYHHNSNFQYSGYSVDGSHADQRDYAIENIISTMEKEITSLRNEKKRLESQISEKNIDIK